MRVISKPRLRQFWEKNQDAQSTLLAWHDHAEHADWNNFAQVRATYAAQASQVGRCVVFNIGGNKYRLVVEIDYECHMVFIVGAYTHHEYDQNAWKTRCC